jgi:hypothetical protein
MDGVLETNHAIAHEQRGPLHPSAEVLEYPGKKKTG